MRRAWVSAAAVLLLLCGCTLLRVPDGTPAPGYDTPWYRAFPTPTPTPSPTPQITPVAASPTPAVVPVETDTFTLSVPYPYTVQTAEGQITVQTENGVQLWILSLDADTAHTALSLPLSLLSKAVAAKLGNGAQITLSDRIDAEVAGRPAVLLRGNGSIGGQTRDVHAYAVEGTEAYTVFVLSWPEGLDAEAELTALLHTLSWK